jgi:hypothetical protein
LLKECSLGWLISSVAFEILRFTVLWHPIVLALICGAQNILKGKKKQGIHVLRVQGLSWQPFLFPILSLLPMFTLWWPCRTQHFHLSSVAGGPLALEREPVVSIPGWWSHGRNCREQTQSRTWVWLQCALSCSGRQLLSPSLHLSLATELYVCARWERGLFP